MSSALRLGNLERHMYVLEGRLEPRCIRSRFEQSGDGITRVGIYGGSAGGLNALGALLFHPDFCDVAVSFAGCHDNRMDKVWWNEQWMGYPIGPEYEASSNVVNAHRLQGRLLLVVPELDTNVDLSSTMQVADALIRSNKTFDLLVMPNEDRGGGRRAPSAAYGDRKMWVFFVHNLLGGGAAALECSRRDRGRVGRRRRRRLGLAFQRRLGGDQGGLRTAPVAGLAASAGNR